MCNRAGAGFMDILTVFVMVVTTGMTIMSGAVSGLGLDMMAVGEIIAAGIDHRVQRLDGLDAVCHRVRRVTSAEFSVGMTTRWRDQRAMFPIMKMIRMTESIPSLIIGLASGHSEDQACFAA